MTQEISRHRRPKDRQGRLFPEPLRGHGHARTVVGNYFEECSLAYLGGNRHVTGGVLAGGYCPDVSVGETYYEVKGAGRTRQTLIYTGRLAKDRAFAAEHELHYIVWHHQASTLCETVDELIGRLTELTVWCAIIPFAEIDTICQGIEPTQMNSQYGKKTYGRSSNTAECEKVYGSGFRISLKLLEPWIVWRK